MFTITMASSKNRFTVSVPGDLERDVEDFAAEHDLSKGESLIRFANRGKIEFGYGGGDSPTTLEYVARDMFKFGFSLGFAFFMLTFLADLPFVYWASLSFFLVAVVAYFVEWAEPKFTENHIRNREAAEEEALEA